MRYALLAVVACCGLFAIGSICHADESAEAKQAGIGKAIAEFKARDYRGKETSLANFASSKLLVVAFIGNDCPLAKRYAPRLQQLADEYASKGVAFVGVNSNLQDTPTEIDAFAKRQGVTFTILKDAGNEVADLFGAGRTPEVFVLDENRAIRYRGRIDDQYSVGYQKQKAEVRDLAVALDELLAGNVVTNASTTAVGCLIGRVHKVEPSGNITYSKQVSRIFNKHCVECHREGELAPFPLTSYEEVIGWAAMIREVVGEGRMPPWFADSRYGHFVNNNEMSAEDQQTLFAWIDKGCLEGDKADLPEPPRFPTGWRIGEPDLICDMPQEFKVGAQGIVAYEHFLFDPQLEEDVWISMAELRPSNPAVVHHVIVYAVPPEEKEKMVAIVFKQRSTGEALFSEAAPADSSEGEGVPLDERGEEFSEEQIRQRREQAERTSSIGQIVAIYTPGMPPFKYPAGTAMKLRKGSVLVFQMHYVPNGTEQFDRSQVGFKFMNFEDVRQEIHYGLAANVELEIPPYAAEHSETSSSKVRADSLLLNLFPHMHFRGKSIRFEAVYPDQTREILLDVPRYDFNWQLRYDLAEPKFLPKGTTLVCTGVFDNSAENLRNPDPSETVRFGLQSWEEMLVGYYTTVLADQNLPRERLVNTLKAMLPNEFWLGVIGSVAMWTSLIAIYRFVARRKRREATSDVSVTVKPPSASNP